MLGVVNLFCVLLIISNVLVNHTIHTTPTETILGAVKLESHNASILILIGGISSDQINKKLDNLKLLILNKTENYCISKRILDYNNKLFLNNIKLDQFKDHLKYSKFLFNFKDHLCSQSEISVTIDKDNTEYLNESNLNDIWSQVQISPEFAKLGFKSCSSSNSMFILITVLISIIVLLLVIILILAYICRKAIKEFWRSFFNRNSKSNVEPSADFNSRKNDEPNNVQYRPKLPTPEEFTKKSNDSNYKGKENIYVHQRQQKASQKVEEIDDFDSDEEFNFPSPLKAPPLPPRPYLHPASLENKNGIHYMVSTIKY